MSPEDAELVERYRDGDLDAAARAQLDARLRDDPAFKRAVVAEVRLGGLIAAVESGLRAAPVLAPGAEPAGRGSPRQRRPRPAPRRTRRLGRAVPIWLAAAAAAVALAAIIVNGRGSAAGLATLVASAPGVALAHDGHLGSASAGSALQADDQVDVPAGASAEIRFADGTDVALAPLTHARLIGGDRRGIDLDAGALTAEVAKQAPGAAMAFRSAEAEALVIGTRLELALTPAGTRLHVSDGLVAFAPRAGGRVDAAHAVQVAAGETALVHSGSATILAQTATPAAGAVPAPAAQELDSEALARAIAPSERELAWLKVGWDTDLWHARRRAQAEGKPMLLWAGWGDPFGMASSECLSDRAALWSDATIQALARERFVAVAVDSWFLSRRTDAVGRFFTLVEGQEPRRGEIPEGILCCTAAGRLLSCVPCGCDRQRTLDALDQALRAAAPAADAGAIPDPGRADASLDPHPPADALIALVAARRVRAQAGGWTNAGGNPGREVLWLPAAAWRALLPARLEPGARASVPDAVAGLIARNALVDTTAGENAVWERANVRSAKLESEVTEASPDLVRLRLHGAADLADGSRAYAPRLAGSIAYSPATGRIVGLTLTALGSWREPGGEEPSDQQLGILISLADDAARLAHPHGARSADAMAP